MREKPVIRQQTNKQTNKPGTIKIKKQATPTRRSFCPTVDELWEEEARNESSEAATTPSKDRGWRSRPWREDTKK